MESKDAILIISHCQNEGVEGVDVKPANPLSFSDGRYKEVNHIQKWLCERPELLKEELLIIADRHVLESGKQPDIIAIDTAGRLIVIEVKRDESGDNVTWQAIRYVSTIAHYKYDDIVDMYHEYRKKSDTSIDEQSCKQEIVDFLYNCDDEDEAKKIINNDQRIMLVSGEFHPDVYASAMWLEAKGISVTCIRLSLFEAGENRLLTSVKVLPLMQPEILSGVRRKSLNSCGENRKSSFFTGTNDASDEEIKAWLKSRLDKNVVSGRLGLFLQILLEQKTPIRREEIKSQFLDRKDKSGCQDIGHAGRLLSNVSQYITKKDSQNLRQILSYEGGKVPGELKDNYAIKEEYKGMVKQVLSDGADNPTP